MVWELQHDRQGAWSSMERVYDISSHCPTVSHICKFLWFPNRFHRPHPRRRNIQVHRTDTYIYTATCSFNRTSLWNVSPAKHTGKYEADKIRSKIEIWTKNKSLSSCVCGKTHMHWVQLLNQISSIHRCRTFYTGSQYLFPFPSLSLHVSFYTPPHASSPE